MRKKLLNICLGLFAIALGGAFVACEDKASNQSNENEPQAPSLAFEKVDDGYAVVGIGTYEDGVLVIPEEYEGEPVTTIAAKAFAYEVEIGVLTIPDSVKTIEAGAFESCSNLSKVTLGGNVSYIGDSAFAYCHTMDSIANLESVVTVGSNAFFACARLKAVTFSDALEVVADSAFESCKRLTSVKLGKSLEAIGNRAFYECVALEGLEIPDGAPTEIMNQAFYGCEAMGYVHLGNDVKSIGEFAFAECKFIRDVKLGDGVVSIGEKAFSSSRKFYQITLGKSLVSIGAGAFEKCWLIREIVNRSNLTIDLNSATKAKDNGGVGAYAWYVRTDDQPTRISKDENGLVYYTDGARKALIAIELTKSGDVIVPDDVTEIAPYAGYSEQFITGLVIGDNCTVIGDSAFRNTYMIQYVTLGESVTEIGDKAFRYNGYIVTIIMPKSLKKVGEEAFLKKVGDKKYRAYKNIYFEGTKAEWDAIRFEEGNDHLIGLDDNNEPIVSIAFYSETEPNGDGLYWYYADGKPTLWN